MNRKNKHIQMGLYSEGLRVAGEVGARGSGWRLVENKYGIKIQNTGDIGLETAQYFAKIEDAYAYAEKYGIDLKTETTNGR